VFLHKLQVPIVNLGGFPLTYQTGVSNRQRYFQQFTVYSKPKRPANLSYNQGRLRKNNAYKDRRSDPLHATGLPKFLRDVFQFYIVRLIHRRPNLEITVDAIAEELQFGLFSGCRKITCKRVKPSNGVIEQRIAPRMQMGTDHTPPRCLNLHQRLIAIRLRGNGVINGINRGNPIFIKNIFAALQSAAWTSRRYYPEKSPCTNQISPRYQSPR